MTNSPEFFNRILNLATASGMASSPSSRQISATLDWCVTFGGVGDQTIFRGANAIAVDSNHAAYVTGLTGSVDFPTSLYTSATLNRNKRLSAAEGMTHSWLRWVPMGI